MPLMPGHIHKYSSITSKVNQIKLARFHKYVLRSTLITPFEDSQVNPNFHGHLAIARLTPAVALHLGSIVGAELNPKVDFNPRLRLVFGAISNLGTGWIQVLRDQPEDTCYGDITAINTKRDFIVSIDAYGCFG